MILGIPIDDWHVMFVGLMWLGTIPLLAWSYFRVSKWRKPLYLIALPVGAMMTWLYAGRLLNDLFAIQLPGNVGTLLRIAVFALALEFYLVSAVDRYEHETKVALQVITEDTDVTTDQLKLDQQSTMDEQHLVMGEQREVMGEQRLSMHDQDEGPNQDGT